jgi:GT2 family glycosyltransferase
MRAGTEATHGHGVAISFFMAGACIIRREAYLDAGGYHPRYHIGAEESLLSLDLAARGWSMRYCDDIVLYHDPSPINRVPDERRRLTLRNRLWTVWLRHSVAFAIRATRWYLHEARSDPIVRQAFLDAVRGLPWVLRERRPISRTLEKEVEALGMLLLE